eukprot:m.91300 g.91300  ORF g.91300 m.91300 type:complete len:209 (-) comp12326_c0_seq7:5432-6058(-)
MKKTSRTQGGDCVSGGHGHGDQRQVQQNRQQRRQKHISSGFEEEEDLLFRNLRLLGFDAHEESTRHHVHCHKRMFNNGNVKGLYVVVYFLLMKLNPLRTKEDFKYCWPLLDRHSEISFRKQASAWLKEIGPSASPRFSKLTSVALTSASGGKTVLMLLHLLSNFVLRREMLLYLHHGSHTRDVCPPPSPHLPQHQYPLRPRQPYVEPN